MMNVNCTDCEYRYICEVIPTAENNCIIAKMDAANSEMERVLDQKEKSRGENNTSRN